MPPFLRVSGVGGKGLREPGPAAERRNAGHARRMCLAGGFGAAGRESRGRARGTGQGPDEDPRRRIKTEGRGERRWWTKLSSGAENAGTVRGGAGLIPGSAVHDGSAGTGEAAKMLGGRGAGKSAEKRGETRDAAGERARKSRGNTTHGRPRRRYVPAGRKLSAACGCFRCGRRIRAWRDTCFCRPR